MSVRRFDDFVAVPISTELYMAIAARYPGSVTSLIEDVVEAFLERTKEEEPFLARSSNGINWSSVFLATGTKLRVKYRNEYKYAEIVEDEIHYDGEVVPSVSKMASVMCNNTSVNAWINVEVKRPSDKTWIIADIIRKG
ncbi:hypothetical protein [Geopsychrobacter electrodiphilus]|uniref:hypothetical protein n=1 Tax=Geopsychrobacter electrodiphilus TaxID=225196 RepID=UPI0003816ECD|nr:hypothetical protein [Geopsychrobacter electrodiphilus]